MPGFKKIPSDIKISIIYIILGWCWILFSDNLVASMFSDQHTINEVQTYKGWFYVLITGILLYFLIKSDLREKNRILKELEAAKKKAEESDKLKTAFLANLSHYIRTPMNSILGFIELLKNRNMDDAKREKFVSIVNEQSEYLLLLINNIVEISKIQEGAATQENTRFSLNQLLKRLKDNFDTKIFYQSKPVRILVFTAMKDGNDEVFTDISKLEYIITNLLSNAVKFTQEGEIWLGYDIKGTNLEFYVIDSGPGIPEDVIPKISNQILDTDPLNAKENSGIGIGMILSKSLVKLLGGKFWIESTGLKGTHFRFSLPLLQNHTELTESNTLTC